VSDPDPISFGVGEGGGSFLFSVHGEDDDEVSLFLLWCLGVEPRDVVGRIVRSVRVKMSINLQDG
jgi:hypothetical protein